MPLFHLGTIVATPACIEWCAKSSVSLHRLICRHMTGDWGDLCDADKRANEQAIREGSRILSCYVIEGTKVYVITEADRSSTCALLADEY